MLSTQETQLGLTTEIVKLLENEILDNNLRSLLEQVLKLNAKWEEEREFLFRKCRFLNDELKSEVNKRVRMRGQITILENGMDSGFKFDIIGETKRRSSRKNNSGSEKDSSLQNLLQEVEDLKQKHSEEIMMMDKKNNELRSRIAMCKMDVMEYKKLARILQTEQSTRRYMRESKFGMKDMQKN